ncbi:hypothetical protein Francci3_0859 [Frankia casuarinae]|uniref:Uncharacterized protein n=1 Tax=Frankia casuarinae (strain DSM 45818 / CECT 9043 / HFP020203 / CcI3) TaxID=106370 RepID=Q2JEP9_FRACC|nr:hypothetical protein Francci3_0859 [Frankia casuarinae]
MISARPISARTIGTRPISATPTGPTANTGRITARTVGHLRSRPEQKHSPGIPGDPRGRRAIVLTVDHSNAGIFLVTVGGALFALLVLGGRAGRGIAREVWSRIGFFRWILLLIIIVIVLDLADGLPNQ